MGLYNFRCVKCGKVSEHFFRMNDLKRPKDCPCGGSLSRLYSFETPADLIYQTTVHCFGPKPVEIHSKRQWKRLLKEHRMTDDFDKLESCVKSDRQRSEELRESVQRFSESTILRAKEKLNNPDYRRLVDRRIDERGRNGR